jgi:hypothetical protein
MNECTPKQLRALLEKARLSQQGAAKVLDIDPRTMRRYIAGELPVPRAIYLAILGIAALEQGTSRRAAPAAGLPPESLR